jgi:hypothetical protein
LLPRVSGTARETDVVEGKVPMQPVKLIERAAGTAAHALKHPIASAAYAAGLARGFAAAAIHGGSATGREREHGRTSTPRLVPTQHRFSAVERDVPPPAPTPLGESFATEPKAVSRQSAHGGPANDAEIDAWLDEVMARDVDVETPVGTTGADVGHNPDTAEADLQQPGTEPLLDPSTAKAIRSESETMRKAAERDLE